MSIEVVMEKRVHIEPFDYCTAFLTMNADTGFPVWFLEDLKFANCLTCNGLRNFFPFDRTVVFYDSANRFYEMSNVLLFLFTIFVWCKY